MGKKLVEKEKLKLEKRITIVEQVSWGERSAVSKVQAERLNLNKTIIKNKKNKLELNKIRLSLILSVSPPYHHLLLSCLLLALC